MNRHPKRRGLSNFVRQQLAALGFPVKQPTDAARVIARMYVEQGTRPTAARLHVTTNTVLRYARIAGVPRRPQGGANNLKDDPKLLITWQGQTKPLHVWAKAVKLPRHVLYYRLIQRAWQVDVAMTTPYQPRKKA